MTSEEYLKETEHAARQLFEGLAHYWNLLEKMTKPVFVTDVPFHDQSAWNAAFTEWREANKETIERSSEISREYFGLSFSNATLCGSVLQIASMGIWLFSRNATIPESCKSFVNEGQDAVCYCIGREVRGLPIGIVIYAARNQYNHWDDEKPRRIMQAVFDFLALGHGHGPARDPAFDLSKPNLHIYSHNVLELLEWHSYDAYHADMTSLICR